MTSAAVLFLDQSYRPLRIEPWRKAALAWMKGKIEVVEYSKDLTIQGVGRTYPMPSVVRVLASFKRDRIRLRFSRINIYARDNFTCQYCGKKPKNVSGLNFDHVLPRSKGGVTSWENIVTSCVSCNDRKADRTPREAGMKLARAPKKPPYLPAISIKMDQGSIPVEWQPYWTAQLEG